MFTLHEDENMERRGFVRNMALLGAMGVPLAGLADQRVVPASDVLADESAIRETLRKYCFLLDDKRPDDFVRLFTENAVFYAADLRYEGRATIKKELAEKPREPGKHLAFPALIQMQSSSEALAWSDFLRVKVKADDPAAWLITNIGRYHDRLVKVGDRWLFAERGVYILGMANPAKFTDPPA